MSNQKSALVSMERYGIDFSMDVPLSVLASLVCMIGVRIDQGPNKVEAVRDGILAKVVEAKNLVDLNPELREEEGFYTGYYLTLCVFLLALDSYLEGEVINLDPLLALVDLKTPQIGAVKPSISNHFH
jgi:hypothetical protein